MFRNLTESPSRKVVASPERQARMECGGSTRPPRQNDGCKPCQWRKYDSRFMETVFALRHASRLLVLISQFPIPQSADPAGAEARRYPWRGIP